MLAALCKDDCLLYHINLRLIEKHYVLVRPVNPCSDDHTEGAIDVVINLNVRYRYRNFELSRQILDGPTQIFIVDYGFPSPVIDSHSCHLEDDFVYYTALVHQQIDNVVVSAAELGMLSVFSHAAP